MDLKLTILVVFVLLSLAKSYGANETTEVDVLILGAGMAGLTAANYLSNNDVGDFALLEAQDYVGGRMKNHFFGGITIGEGPNWVHFVEDGEDNPLLQLTKKLKLRQHTQDVFDVEIKNAPGGAAAYNETVKTLFDAAKKVTKDYEVKMPPREDQSFPSSLANKGWRADTGLKSAVQWFFYDFEFAVNANAISSRYSEIPEINNFVTDSRGYATVIEYLAKNISKKIKTGTIVTEIKYDSKGVEVRIKNGHVYKAKYALCTFSTGVLASDLVKFVPEIPAWKKEAINKIPQAYYTHIFVKFPTAFWEDKTFLMSAGRVDEEYPLVMNLNKKGFHPGSNILIFSAIDDDSLRVENQAENATVDEIMKALHRMYPSINITRPTEIFVSKWSRNPYVRGSYSNAVVGTSMADFHNLEGRVKNVFFAGEGCSGEYFGYLQGGYYTAQRQTKVITSCLKGKECAPYEPEKNNLCAICNAVASGGSTVDLILLCFLFIIYAGC